MLTLTKAYAHRAMVLSLTKERSRYQVRLRIAEAKLFRMVQDHNMTASRITQPSLMNRRAKVISAYANHVRRLAIKSGRPDIESTAREAKALTIICEATKGRNV